MQYIKRYLNYGLILLVIAGEGLAYGAVGDGGLWLYLSHLVLVIPFFGRFILFALEEEERTKLAAPNERIMERADFDLVVKSQTVKDENYRRLSHYSSLFIHLKNLATTKDEDQQIKLFFDLLQKNLGFSKISFFDYVKDDSKLKLRRTTDMKIHSGQFSELEVNEETLLGYAAFHIEGLNESQVSQNIRISHLDLNDPISMKLCMPITFDEELLGIVNVGQTSKEELSREEQNFLSTLCSLLGLSINNARNFAVVESNLANSEKLVIEKDKLNERIKGIFGKFTSPNVVNALIDLNQELVLGGESKVTSLMFCDIRSFTSYCEKHSPAEVVEILNEYLSHMSEIIIKYHGTLDKYIGDEIMAFWGAPLEEENHAKLAVQAGFEMLMELKKLTIKWEKDGRIPFSVGIGINTGEVIVGNMGSSIRMDYTVIGDSVNLAARVESLTRKFKSDFLITESTYQLTKDIVQARKMGALRLKGKQEPSMIYSVEKVDLKPLK